MLIDNGLIFQSAHMPNLDGWEATRRIRAWSSDPDVSTAARKASRLPIVALTASALPEERARCDAVGMDFFLPKPVKLGELRERLENLQKE